jgi:23S rRNA pseudouridine1911/1915/1917 synthase
VELHVPPERAGERLDQLLADEVGSRSRAVKLIDEGLVTVDGDLRQKRYKVAAGDVVVWREPDPAVMTADPTEPDVPFTVPYEDEHLLIVDKPAGLVVHPARGHWTGTLAQALAGRAAGGDETRPGIVHRLDRDTSGLLVVARSEEAHRRLKDLIGSRLVEREYLALVLGRPPARTGTIDAPIGTRPPRPDPQLDRHGHAARGPHPLRHRARAARDDPAARAPGDRPHPPDPRAPGGHRPPRWSAIPEYGGSSAGPDLGLQRQFLHATRLAFTHPVTGDAGRRHQPAAADLAEALDRAGRGGRLRAPAYTGRQPSVSSTPRDRTDGVLPGELSPGAGGPPAGLSPSVRPQGAGPHARSRHP